MSVNWSLLTGVRVKTTKSEPKKCTIHSTNWDGENFSLRTKINATSKVHSLIKAH